MKNMNRLAASAGSELPTGGGVISSDQRREQARNAILKAAWRALARDGYEKITTRRIAEMAGVNVATLHYYFGTKESLLSEASRFALQDTEKRLRKAMEQEQTSAAALESLFAEVWRGVQEQPGALRYDLVVRGFRDETAREDVLAIYSGYRRLVEQLVERHLREGGTLSTGVTATGLSYYLLSAIDGVLLQHVLTKDDIAAQNALTMVKKHALSLLNAE